MYNYLSNVWHKIQHPDHVNHIVTSKVYGDGTKFIILSKKFKKYLMDPITGEYSF